MAIKQSFVAVLLCLNFISANVKDPFPQGFSMGNLGTILLEDGEQGAQPWIPAAFCKSSRKFGLACGAVSYYDRMDNFRDELMYRAFGGGWYEVGRFKLKIAVSHFSALGFYYEQSGFLSMGIDLFRHLRVSADVNGTRIGLTILDEKPYNNVECGFSGWIPFRYAAVSLSVNHIVIKSGYTEGIDPLISISTGIHSVRNRLGAQGVLVEITPYIKHPIRFILGEQYRFFKIFSIDVSIANNPFLIGLGVSLEMASVKSSVSLVNHSVLGWSKGFAVMY